MTAEEQPSPALPPEPNKEPRVREGEHEGAPYRIETYHEPEEL